MTSADLHRAAAHLRAEALMDIILEIGPARPLREVAAELNERRVPTDRGGQWHPATVARVLRRLGIVPGIELGTGSIRQLPLKSISAVVTSPPYANQRKQQYGGILPTNYPCWTVDWLSKIKPALVDGGNVAIVLNPHAEDGQISDYVLRTRLAIREAGWIEASDLYWIKHDAPPLGDNRRARRSVESILWFSNSRHAYCDPKANGVLSAKLGAHGRKGAGEYYRANRENYEGVARCRNFVEVTVASNDRSTYNHHPAVYPVGLAEWIIKLLCPPGGIVIDPFMGSGTTALAARNTSRRFIGCDIREDYVAIARRRLDEQTRKTR